MGVAWGSVLVAAVGAAVSIAVGGELLIPATVAGYVAGALLTTIFASVYRSMRNARRSLGRFRPEPGIDRMAMVSVFAGLALGLFNAFLLATELAK